MSYQEEIEDLITQTSALTNKPLILGTDFYIEYQPLKHTPKKLPKGKMAVYTFVYNNHFLKIGQADKNSNARYQSQHYHIKSSKSTLANSLLLDKTMSNLVNIANVKQWIKDNCERYDVILDARLGKHTLNYIEGILHYQYQPKYEG